MIATLRYKHRYTLAHCTKMHQGFSSLMRTSIATFKLTHGDLNIEVLDRDVVRPAPCRSCRSGITGGICCVICIRG